jgi:hypothetical protein
MLSRAVSWTPSYFEYIRPLFSRPNSLRSTLISSHVFPYIVASDVAPKVHILDLNFGMYFSFPY